MSNQRIECLLIFSLLIFSVDVLSTEQDYITPPQIIENQKLSARLTRTVLNGNSIDHTTQGYLNLGTVYGDSLNVNNFYSDNRKENLRVDALYTFKNQVEQSLSNDQIYTSDQQGHYFQVKTITKNQEVILTKSSPQTLQGMRMKATFTGSCSALPNSDSSVNSTQQCQMIPSLITDEKSINQRYFFPGRVFQSNKMGDVVSDKTLAGLAQPGFQNTDENGQPLGIDLYLPNIGALPGNSDGKTSSMSRKDNIKNGHLLGYSRVRKIIKTNHNKAVMGLTIHGLGGILDSDNAATNFSLSAGAQFLPDVIPGLSGGEEQTNTSVNDNLLNAAANTRIPENSWTIYQAGMGEANHPAIHNGIAELPAAYFNTLWLGLSPHDYPQVSQIAQKRLSQSQYRQRNA